MLKKLVAAVLVLGLLGLTACVADYRAPRNGGGVADLSYIMVFEGEQVSIDELKTRVLLRVILFETEMGGDRTIWEDVDRLPAEFLDLFFGQGMGTAFERMRASALEELIESLIVAEHAARRGIVVTDAVTAAAMALAEAEHALLSQTFGRPFPLSVDTLAAIFIEEVLLEMLLAQIEETLSTDDPLFLQYFEAYMETARNFLNTVYIYYVAADSYENALQAKTRLEAGENAADVARDLSVDYDYEFGRVNLWQLPRITATSHPEDMVEIFAMDIGQVSEIIEADGYYIVTKVEEIIEPENFDEAKDRFMTQVFAPYMVGHQLENWQRTAIFQINRAALDSITLSYIHEILVDSE